MSTPVLSGSALLVNTTTAFAQQSPEVTQLGDGRSLIVWQDASKTGGDASGTAIRAQILRADGTREGGEILINTVTFGDQIQPAVTLLTNGDFVVAWTVTQATSGDANGAAVKAQVFSNTGTPLGAEILVNNLPLFSQSRPEVTALDDGGFVVTFNTPNNTFAPFNATFDVNMRLFDADGTPRGNEVTVNQSDVSLQTNGHLTTLANGTILAVWNQTAFGNEPDPLHDMSRTGIVARLLAADGTPLTAQFGVNTLTGGDQQDPEVAALTGGGFVVTWRDNSRTAPDTSAEAIRAQVFDASGTKVGAEIVVNTTTAQRQDEPAITGLSDGRFMIAWTDWSAPVNWDIRAQLFNADGTALGTEFLVTTASGNQNNPALAELSDGRVMISWREGNDTGGGNIAAQIVDPREAALVFAGTGGNDIAVGTRFNDRLAGRSGDDNLIGAAGRDTLSGAAGDDVLTGGLGADQLSGGRGADTFVFTSPDDSDPGNRDRITDFRLAQGDLIDLSALDANTTTAGDDAFAFVGAAAFTALGQVRVTLSGTDTLVEVNSSGSTAADMHILLTGQLTLDALDFAL